MGGALASTNHTQIDQAWKHLYRNASDFVVHAAVLNQRFDYMHEYLERGADPNARELSAEWTPLHCAAYVGHTKYVKFLVQRPYIDL